MTDSWNHFLFQMPLPASTLASITSMSLVLEEVHLTGHSCPMPLVKGNGFFEEMNCHIFNAVPTTRLNHEHNTLLIQHILFQ
jgi:hypothetical protein